jgi:hypothetical protein
MLDRTRNEQPSCANCGGLIHRRRGVWVHGNQERHCPDTTTREEPHPVAAPKDEIR